LNSSVGLSANSTITTTPEPMHSSPSPEPALVVTLLHEEVSIDTSLICSHAYYRTSVGSIPTC
jgi:hypothetical protein